MQLQVKLTSHLKEESSNDTIVILDNVPFHHSANVIEMLELRGFPYKFLPPYSPYFMDIECMFAEWKTYVKRELIHLLCHRIML